MSMKRLADMGPWDWPEDAGKHAHDYRLKPQTVNATFCYHARLVLKDEAECLTED